MEDAYHSRRCRRSIRVIRRSSNFFTDLCTPSLEFEESGAAPDNEEAFDYGSVWVENNSNKKSCNKQVVNQCAKDEILSTGVDGFDSSECLHKQDMFSAVNQGSKLAHEFLDSHNAFVNDESLAHCATMASNSCRDLTNTFVKSSKSENDLEEDLYDQRQAINDVDFDGKLQQQIDSSCASANSIASHENVIHDKDASSMKDNVSSPQTDPSTVSVLNKVTLFDKRVKNDEKVSVFRENTKQLKSADFRNAEENMKDHLETFNTSIKSGSLKKEVRNTFKAKIETSDLLTSSTESRKDRRKSESHLINQDIGQRSDYESKKRKRLSLKTARTRCSVLEQRECNVVESHVDKDIELTHSSNMGCESLKENNNNVIHVTSKTCSSELKNFQWIENQDNLDFMDFEFSDDMLTNFNAENCCPPESTEKKNKQTKAKSTRRSSRYFFLHEMPLSDSSEPIPVVPQHPTSEINNSAAVTGTPKFTKSYNEKSRLNTPDKQLNTPRKAWSSEFSKSCTGDNKRNTPNEQLETPRKVWCLEDVSHTSVHDSPHLNAAFIEDVLEDLAHLCVSEETFAEISGQPLQGRRQSDGRRRSGYCQTGVSTPVSSKDTEGNKDCMEGDCQQVDKPLSCMSSQDVLSSHENVSNDKEVTYNKDGIEFDYKSESDFKDMGNNEESGDSCVGFMSSSSTVDVDMDETPSPAKDDVESQPPADSESKIIMRLRRNRKSWGICQLSDSNKEKKPPRRVIRQQKAENQTSMSDNSQFSTPIDKTGVTAQSNDNEVSSEINNSQSSDEDIVVSPGLLCLYTNKNYVMPQPKLWETIKESPKSNQPLFSKQQRKRFLEFENNRTLAKLQRRHKKALNIYKKVSQKLVPITDEEFERRMLDTQLLLDGL